MNDGYNDFTLLGLGTIGVVPYSARGLTQSLEPIDQAKQYDRTINGALVDLSLSQFRKYRSQISCNDQRVPALDGAFPGKIIEVECVQELSYLTVGGAPARPVVTGSSRVEGLYTFYRPKLMMMITNYASNIDEYGAAVGWNLDLEEI